MQTSFDEEKSLFLKGMSPSFPDVSKTAVMLRAPEYALAGDEHWQKKYFRAAEEIYFPLWQALAPVYAAALARSVGADRGKLVTVVADWPSTLELQQQRLNSLLQEGKLRQAWRDYGMTYGEDFLRKNDHSQIKAARLIYEDCKEPMREVPLYQEMFRTSCQQLVCMPVVNWQSLYEPSKTYDPQMIEPATVDRLATRIAHVFNAPPLVDVSLLRQSMSWNEPIVWDTNASALTKPINSHGMRDRWEADGWLGEIEQPSADIVAPQWRYEGFYGQVRVTLESGEDWYVTILAPMHFVRHLAYYAEWFRRENSP